MTPLTDEQRSLAETGLGLSPHFSFRMCGYVDDDLVADGNFALSRAAKSYNNVRGCKFSTYASVAVKNAQKLSLMREFSRRSRMEPLNNRCPVCDVDDWSETAEEVRRCLSKVHGRRRLVLELRFIQGMTLQAIGSVLGLTRERARQLQNAGLEEMRSMLAGRL